MEQNEKQQQAANQAKKNLYRRLIETGRDELSERQMEVLFTLYEQPTKELAAAELQMTVDELDDEFDVITRWHQSTEPQTKEGIPRKKRLGKAALINALEFGTDLTDEEEAMIQAAIDSPNQDAAARSLGMSYGDFAKQFLKIRRARGF